MSGASANWYYVLGNDRKGPLSESQIAALFSAGVINGQTNVWSEHLTAWTPLLQTDLRKLMGSSPVEPPPFAGSSGSVPAFQSMGQDGMPPTGSNPAAAQVTSFGQSISACFNKYVTFRGRANRAELWWFILFIVLTSIVLAIVDAGLFPHSQFSPLSTLFQLATFLPMLAAEVRRLHDTDRSGWWILLGLVPIVGGIVVLVFLCLQGTQGRNRFG